MDRRVNHPSLIEATFEEVVANNAEVLVDWPNLFPEAKTFKLKLSGNSYMQGSTDGINYSNNVTPNDTHLRVSTDGGNTWRVIELWDDIETHPPLTLGSPSNGLGLDETQQILTLDYVTTTSGGAMIPDDKVKLDNLKFDYLENIGGGFELFKEYTDSVDDRFHKIRTIVPGTGVTLSYVGDTIEIEATGAGGGQNNVGANVSTDGIGVFDGMNGVYLNFRGIASITDILTVTLDDVGNDIDINIIESNINHDILENYIANEHIDHSLISILTQEGITGGGDLTATRTLTLAFDELSLITYKPENLIAVYDATTDLHYKLPLSYLPGASESNPVSIIAGSGLYGGGVLDQDRNIRLSINTLPTVPYAPEDFLAVYDVSNSNHAKVTLSELIGQLSVNITAGNGMDFPTITSTGAITMGTPTTLTKITGNSASGTTHEHIVDLSSWNLQDLGNIDTPVNQHFVYYDLATNRFKFADPAIGASTPGLPLYSIQFNDNNTFGGNAGLLYKPLEDRVYIDKSNTITDSGFIFGPDSTYPSILSDGQNITLNFNSYVGLVKLGADRLMFGNPVDVADRFMQIKDPSGKTKTITVTDSLDEIILELGKDGSFLLPKLGSQATENILYFDPVTGNITHGAKPTGVGGGGISTLIADNTSGLMVNGGNSSSASSIELDQNDNKLTLATPIWTDYIGFYDESTGLQSKTRLHDIPGWYVKVNGGNGDEISIGSAVNFEQGTGIVLDYDTVLNTLKISASGAGGGCSQLVDSLGTITNGNTAYLDLNVYSGATMTIASGASVVLQFDNIEEGDTGHIEVNHNGDGNLQLSAPGASIKIADNSYQSPDTVYLSPFAAIDVVAYWYALGNFHAAVIYNTH